MTNKEYTVLAIRTESPADPLKYEIGKANAHLPWMAKSAVRSRLLHSALGCADEAGELVKCIKDRLFYGKPIDVTNLKEEYGDLLWYIALGLAAINSSFEEVMELNIQKLRARFPDKFTQEKATIRDLEAEKTVLENTQRDVTGQNVPPLPFFDLITEVGLPMDALIIGSTELLCAITAGQVKGKIVKENDHYVLKIRE